MSITILFGVGLALVVVIGMMALIWGYKFADSDKDVIDLGKVMNDVPQWEPPVPILLNSIRTPDGTVLVSRTRHDCQTHVDLTTGLEYMVDGGKSYLRRSANGDEVDMSVMLSDDHFANRRAFHWGTRGWGGRNPLTWKPLAELDTDHIKAILETQHQIKGGHIEKLMQSELELRNAGL